MDLSASGAARIGSAATPSRSRAAFASASNRLARARPCAAARRSSAPSSPGRPARPRAPPAWPPGSARPSRSAGAALAAARARRPASVSKIDSRAFASRRWRWKPSAKRCASSRIRCRSCRPGEWRVEHDRVGAAGHEDLLVALGERDHRHARQVEGLHRRERRRQLALAAVDHDEVRRRGERLVVLLVGDVAQPGEPARDHLRHRREVVLARRAPARRTCGSAPSSAPRPGRRPSSRPATPPWMFEMSKHSIRIGRLSRLSASRSSSSASTRRSRLRSATDGLRARAPARAFSVASSCEPPLLAALGDAHLDPRAAPLGEELLRARRCPRRRAGRRSAAARSAPSRSTRGRTPRGSWSESCPSTFSRWKP